MIQKVSMEKQPTISIIIPVYNTEKYLRRCLDSILAQTYKDFECILVDDGSTDDSGKICDEYAAKDNRFRVIHKENGGVATARQAGTEAAKGEYIIHADPDDWTEPEMLEQMYTKAKETDADVTICNFYSTNYKGEDTLFIQRPVSLEPHKVMQDIVLTHKLHGSLWNKLTKRACYIKYGLHFTPGINYCEDVLIWVQLFQHPKVKVAYLNKAFYHYFQGNSDSITHSRKPEVIETMRRYYTKLEAILPNNDKYIAENEWVSFYFWLWRIHYYSASDFRNKKIPDEMIKRLYMRKKFKLSCLMINKGWDKAAKILMATKKPWNLFK